MDKSNPHIIGIENNARAALQKLDSIPNLESRTLFVVDDVNKMIGALTDGDIRRGLLSGLEISDSLHRYINKNFKYINEAQAVNPAVIKGFKNKGIKLIPVIDEHGFVARIIDFDRVNTILPLSALLMAGGRGERLRPLTDNTPKPMLKVGDKPILEINIDRLISYGISDFYISIKYLGHIIKDYFGDGSSKGISITYIEEDEPLGTIGALSKICPKNDNMLVMNSDVLTNIDFEDFYNEFVISESLMMVASVPYKVKIPYGIMKLNEHGSIESLIEKPTYNYYSNAGIYMLKSKLQQWIPQNTPFNATDLMDVLIQQSQSIKHFPILNYWLDIGKHEDFLKAQSDIKYIKF
ncbi:MAG TPA: nucleotidyltransferase [Chitinophagaceae bacterium]|nr:nucleotidyltransferase [Chitinophagaceae bacterium]